MVQLTFPQAGDLPDAAYFAFAAGRGRSGVISGLTLTADFAVPEVTVAPGKAAIDRGDMSTSHPNINPSETVSDAAAIVETESQTVSLTSGTLNHIFLDANVGNDDSPTVIANTTGSPPTTASVKIGEVDANANTVSGQWNLITEDGTLSYPDADAANSEVQSLPTGVSVINRGTGVRISDGGVSVSSVEAVDSFTGPGGNTSTRRVGLPTGAVIMFSGSTSDIPDGYTLCDGTDPRSGASSVPDLRNRFIAGAGDEYTVGTTGGEKEHQLTLGELPSHSHGYDEGIAGGASGDGDNSFASVNAGLQNAQTDTAGNDEAHENRPRFFSLAFIFKL